MEHSDMVKLEAKASLYNARLELKIKLTGGISLLHILNELDPARTKSDLNEIINFALKEDYLPSHRVVGDGVADDRKN
jgi:hypothetical protein